MSENAKKSSGRLVYIYFSLAIVAILIIGLFRDSLFIRGDTGRIVIDRLEAGSAVYVDKIESKVVNSTRENVSLRRLHVGTHSILIVRAGFWPWLKEVEIKKGEKIFLSPFAVSENSSGFFIDESDPEYESLLARFSALAPPDFENKKISEDGNIAFWVDESTIFVEWLGEQGLIPSSFCNESDCPRVTVPLTVGGDIRNVDFYKGRNDVLIVSFGNGVFAIEIDSKNHQNFQPIFEGQSPQFLLKSENSIYVLDGGVLREVAI